MKSQQPRLVKRSGSTAIQLGERIPRRRRVKRTQKRKQGRRRRRRRAGAGMEQQLGRGTARRRRNEQRSHDAGPLALQIAPNCPNLTCTCTCNPLNLPPSNPTPQSIPAMRDHAQNWPSPSYLILHQAPALLTESL